MMPFLILFYPMIISMAILFTRLSHPLAMGLGLLFQTVLICCVTGLSNLSFWFSYILFLIFLGGMLVLFIYITSLASNEMFKPSPILVILMLMLSSVSLITIMLDPLLIPQTPMFKMSSYMNMTPYSMDLSLVSTIYNSTNMNMTIFMVFYLLLTLIVVVKITDTFFGPLRLSMN